MRKNTIIALLTLFAVSLPATSEAGILDLLKKLRKKTATTATAPAEKKKSAYEKLFSGKKVESSKSTFLTLHKMDGKVYVELPRHTLGEEMLVGATLSSISNPHLGMLGFKNSNPLHFRFVQRDSAVVWELVNTEFINRKNQSVGNGKKNYADLPLYTFNIEAYSADSSSIVFDASSFFLSEQRFFPVMNSRVGRYSVQSNPNPSLTNVVAVKAFSDNASVKVDRSYTVTLQGASSTPVQNRPVTLGVTFSLVKLPKERMLPRLADTRIGIFSVPKDYMDEDLVENVAFIKRWRIEPTDTAAYLAGELSEVKKPIVFYIENTFPKLWKQAARDGILRWNKAFERAGFKNVVQVRDFPTPQEDPEFDPDNLKYSCVRFIPIGIENAMGPSWTDPRTGEIINASILVYSDIAKVLNNWRFVQTAQLDERVRRKVMPDEIIKQSLEYVLAHEVGHTLGFMHNMAASAAYSVDSLRSPVFTHKYGTTPSIMDYARYNYVAQPQDKGVSLEPPFLGVYDYFMVDWAYRAFPRMKGDFVEEGKALKAILEAKTGDPLFRYGVQQFETKYDPSAIEEDLSNDPVRAGTLGFANLRYILAHLDEWIKDDESTEHKEDLYSQILSQAYGYVNNVFLNVPGIYLTQTSEQSGLPRYQVVPKQQQKASAQWLLRQVQEFADMGNGKLEGKMFFAGNRPFQLMAKNVQAMAMINTSRLALSYYLDSTSYAPHEYAEDVYQFVFKKTLAGETTLSDVEKDFQSTYIRYLAGFAQDIKQVSGGLGIRSESEMLLQPFASAQPETEEEVWFSLQPTTPFLCGACSHHSDRAEHQPTKHNHSSFLNFGTNGGVPDELWGATVNRTKDLMFHYLLKTEEMLKKASAQSPSAELKLHYAFLLGELKKAKK